MNKTQYAFNAMKLVLPARANGEAVSCNGVAPLHQRRRRISFEISVTFTTSGATFWASLYACDELFFLCFFAKHAFNFLVRNRGTHRF